MWVKWLLFNTFLFSALFFDIYTFKKNPERPPFTGALKWTFFWVFLALFYGFLTSFIFSTDHMMKYFTGYLLEKSLSIDNLFVFVAIFITYDITAKNQHRVLFWGILGALIMRGFFIVFGLFLINKFNWIFYIIGLFLGYTSIQLFLGGKERETFSKSHKLDSLVKKYIRLDLNHKGPYFFIRKKRQTFVTGLFITLIMIELMDLIFALDSIPAIFSVTQDPYIIYTANAFAILGLRSLFFVIESSLKSFYYLRYGLSFLLLFISIKMLMHPFYQIPVGISLIAIILILFITCTVSYFQNTKD